MPPNLMRQAEQMYTVFAELVRRYQFRDRDQVCCHGLSVSQCYTLELLADGAPRTMGALAAEICLKISTATRVVDYLVANDLVRRVEDPNDRRVCRVQITKAGQALISRVRSEIVAEYEAVLKEVPPHSRKAVIDVLSHLLAAFKQRQCSASEPHDDNDGSGSAPARSDNQRSKNARRRKTAQTIRS